MSEMQALAKTVVWWGFGLGLIFGFFANKTNFCTMGAVSDAVNMGDMGRMRAWLLTIAVAILGTNILAYTGKIGWAENPETLTEMAMGTNSKLAESMSFIAPSGYTLELWSLWTDTGTVVTWGIAAVFGVGVGSFLYAVATKAFRWEHFVSAQDMFRHIIGGTLMGFGGVTALGCTIGQGVTGFSTLSIGSIITFVGIVAGAAATMKFEYWRMLREA